MIGEVVLEVVGAGVLAPRPLRHRRRWRDAATHDRRPRAVAVVVVRARPKSRRGSARACDRPRATPPRRSSCVRRRRSVNTNAGRSSVGVEHVQQCDAEHAGPADEVRRRDHHPLAVVGSIELASCGAPSTPGSRRGDVDVERGEVLADPLPHLVRSPPVRRRERGRARRRGRTEPRSDRRAMPPVRVVRDVPVEVEVDHRGDDGRELSVEHVDARRSRATGAGCAPDRQRRAGGRRRSRARRRR